jgi:chromosome segregation ATPase
MSDDLVKRLREVSLEKHQEAWARSDGGQDLTIGGMLADEAADRIEELEAKLEAALQDADEAEAYAWELEQRLTKAVEALEEIQEEIDNSKSRRRQKQVEWARGQMQSGIDEIEAELKGQDDDN